MIKQKKIDNIKPALLEMITESGWVRGPGNPDTVLFTTPLLKKLVPQNGKLQWLDNYIFVFEIVNFNTLYFITKMIPGEEETRDLIFNAFSGLDCLSKPKVKKDWINHVWHISDFTVEDFVGKNKDVVKVMLKEDWGKITGMVKKVEAELLKHKVEFKNIQIKKLKQHPHWHRWGQPAQKSHTKVRQQPDRMFPHRSAA